MLSRSFALAITGYQKYISPYKGFCCAYRVKHGGLSCSDYVKQTLLQHGVWRAIPATRQRFDECKAAAAALSMEISTRRGERDRRQNNSRRRGRRDSKFDFCECCNPIDAIPTESCNLLEGGADACSCSL